MVTCGPEPSIALRFEAQVLEPFSELGQLAATINQAVDAGPGGMGLGIDIQFQDVAGRPPGGPGRIGATIGHLDGDFVIIGMYVFFHSSASSLKALYIGEGGLGYKGGLMTL